MVAAEMPADGPVRLESVQLPVGRRASDWDDALPRLWATSKPVPDAGRVWQALTDIHHDTGLVPILLGFLDGGHEGRPWDNGEFGPRCDLVTVDRLDTATVLAGEWSARCWSRSGGAFTQMEQRRRRYAGVAGLNRWKQLS